MNLPIAGLWCVIYTNANGRMEFYFGIEILWLRSQLMTTTYYPQTYFGSKKKAPLYPEVDKREMLEYESVLSSQKNQYLKPFFCPNYVSSHISRKNWHFLPWPQVRKEISVFQALQFSTFGIYKILIHHYVQIFFTDWCCLKITIQMLILLLEVLSMSGEENWLCCLTVTTSQKNSTNPNMELVRLNLFLWLGSQIWMIV